MFYLFLVVFILCGCCSIEQRIKFNIKYRKIPYLDAKESGKVILLEAPPESEQHQNLINSTGSSLARAYQVCRHPLTREP